MNRLSKKKARVQINHKFCKLCGICVDFCPVKNLLITDHKLIDFAKCTGCGTCEKRCPDFAITIITSNE